MAAERTQNLQDTFLNHVRKNKIPLTIFLVNGVKLQGVVTWFDNFCVLAASRRALAAGLQARDLDDHAGPARSQLFEPGEESAGSHQGLS